MNDEENEAYEEYESDVPTELLELHLELEEAGITPDEFGKAFS